MLTILHALRRLGPYGRSIRFILWIAMLVWRRWDVGERLSLGTAIAVAKIVA